MPHAPVIGLEVHVQLLTRTKIFCGCANRFNPDEPNTQTCPVCLGLPGSLPVLNGEAFRLSLIAALALHCEIAPFTKWDRKQYYYPDLPKGFQISQYDLPFSHDGWLEVPAGAVGQEAGGPGSPPYRDDGGTRRIRIRRAHLEEDAGKNLHDETGRGADSRVDLNRAGTPLLEIVTEPDLCSGAETKAFLDELYLLLTYLGVSDCNMQEGSLRCDANVNVRIDRNDGTTVATPIVEVKNLNSFRGVEASVEYEVQRQAAEFAKTGRKLGDAGAEKETRGWDADRGVTFPQRGKEEASDYRYFPDPDLVPVTVNAERLADARNRLCELPASRRRRFQEQCGLSIYDASVVVNQGREFADYFEQVTQICGDAKQAANWVTQDVLREMNQRHVTIEEFPVRAAVLGTLLNRIVTGAVTVKSAREVFADLLAQADAGNAPPEEAVDRTIDARGLRVVSDAGALQAAVDAALAGSPRAVEDFKAGKQQAIGPLVGKVMQQVKGADPKIVREMLVKKLTGV
jgi:aspartyl-tRNA(Asn)/glutamyl-tRNA(Gln) amidotransferase subunit B